MRAGARRLARINRGDLYRAEQEYERLRRITRRHRPEGDCRLR